MQKNERLRKEYKITPSSNNFKAAFGIINRKAPSVMYIKLNTWVNYKDDIKDYDENVGILNTKVKAKIKNELRDSELFNTMFFYTPEMKKTLTKTNAPFHACFELTIRKKLASTDNVDLIVKEAETLINNIIETIEDNEIFEFNLKKNKI